MSFCNCQSCGLRSVNNWPCGRLSAEQLEGLGGQSNSLTLKRKSTLDHTTTENWPVIAVIEGAVGLQTTLADGRQTITAFYTPGDIIDLRGPTAHAKALLVALTRARICQLQPDVFQSILELSLIHI